MRVVSGSAKGKKLLAVPGEGTRPILDRVKTALFDMLRPTLADATVPDLFAGSGGVGIEALSQGAAHCVFVDLSNEATMTIKKNLATTGLAAQAEVRTTDASTYLKNCRKTFDLVYIAPPQYRSLWLEALHALAERPELLSERGQIIVQVDPKEYESVVLREFGEIRQKRYGNTLLVFYERREL